MVVYLLFVIRTTFLQLWVIIHLRVRIRLKLENVLIIVFTLLIALLGLNIISIFISNNIMQLLSLLFLLNRTLYVINILAAIFYLYVTICFENGVVHILNVKMQVSLLLYWLYLRFLFSICLIFSVRLRNNRFVNINCIRKTLLVFYNLMLLKLLTCYQLYVLVYDILCFFLPQLLLL